MVDDCFKRASIPLRLLLLTVLLDCDDEPQPALR